MKAPASPSGRALLLDRLRGQLGDEHVDEATRPPYILCRPGSALDVAAALEAAAVGGVSVSCAGAPEALVQLDLGRLRRLSLEETSLLCTAEAGLPLGELERALRAQQLSLGPLPPRTLGRTLGAALGAPRPSEAAPLLGRLRDRPVRIEAVLPDRRVALLPVQPAPRRAAGPDFKHLLIGGRGRTGVITAATLPVQRVGPALRCAGWMVRSCEAGAAAACELLRRTGVAGGPADLQVVSRELLAALAGEADLPPGPAALLLRAEGPPGLVEAQVALGAALGDPGAALPETLCRAWLDPGPGAAPWPAGEAPLCTLSPAALGAALARTAGPRLLCAFHLHGAALCAPPEALPAAAPAGGAARLFEQLCAQLDPQQLLR